MSTIEHITRLIADLDEERAAHAATREELANVRAQLSGPHPDRPHCTTVGGKGVRVVATDLETGESKSVVIDNNYVLICAGNRYQSGVQLYANGTTIVTIKTRTSR